MLKITSKKDADIVTGDMPCTLCPMGRGSSLNCGENFRKKYGMSCMDMFVTVELKIKSNESNTTRDSK